MYWELNTSTYFVELVLLRIKKIHYSKTLTVEVTNENTVIGGSAGYETLCNKCSMIFFLTHCHFHDRRYCCYTTLEGPPDDSWDDPLSDGGLDKLRHISVQ